MTCEIEIKASGRLRGWAQAIVRHSELGIVFVGPWRDGELEAKRDAQKFMGWLP